MPTQEKLKELTNFLGVELPDLKGERGDAGEKGDSGIQGEKGEQGDKGEQGERGLRGEKGDRGEEGGRGERGEGGEKGDKGETGDPGTPGQDGQTEKVKIEELKELIRQQFTERAQMIPRGGGGGYSFMQRRDDLRVFTQTAATRNEGSNTGWNVILCDCTSNNITINLPSAVGNQARLTIKKTDSSANTVTVDAAASQTIDGGLTSVFSTQYTSITIISDNSNWHIV